PCFMMEGALLCRREVEHYKRLDTAERIQWVDIHTQPKALEAYGIGRADAMRRLHVLTPEGKMVLGAHAFAAIWSQLPYYRRLAAFLRPLRALQPLDVLYGLFARWRFRRRVADGGRQHQGT
ncbi:MAG: DUF393 domain-containing protein, partial [Gammaproteobacteria bacterium]